MVRNVLVVKSSLNEVSETGALSAKLLGVKVWFLAFVGAGNSAQGPIAPCNCSINFSVLNLKISLTFSRN